MSYIRISSVAFRAATMLSDQTLLVALASSLRENDCV